MLKMIVFGIMLILMSLISMFFGFYILFMNKLLIYEWMIYNLSSMKMNLILMISFKLLMFMFLVMLICSMILLYSVSYMNLNNKYLIKRFYYLMMLFLMSMIFLILSPNMLTLLLGWDGLGLISYCLIIYYQKNLAFNSGMMTVILNRLGDSSLLMIISFLMIFGSWNLILYNMNLLILIMFLIMVFSKSAQLMFMIWLPAAMMAPTPVSSLVHSSTLVTAGIYLLINYEMLIDLKYKEYILMISSMTMFMAGVMANFEMDFKKIIALSTLSQLGFMMSIYSLGMVNLTFLHLFIHAFFKSMMFMCVGSFIHYMKGIQNFRFYMLCGFPFLVGFYSKDLIIEYYFLNMMSIFSLLNLIIGTIFTVSYSFRLMYILMMNNFMMNLIYLDEDNIMMNYMMFILLIMLFISKFIYNFFFFHIKVNLFYIFKYFVFKMMLLGIMFPLNKIVLFIKSFFMMDFFYKFILNYLMYWLIFYEIYFEKGMIEKFTGKIMNFFCYLLEMIYMLKIFFMLLMYIYLMMLIMFN
uniref:NADH:ubiquinone reductase (H(+)-translocating) n=1 Tax=Bombus hypocrita sapporensis TaxID=1079038 RepID=B8Q9C7_BOMHP|nr:NADH dehydrogenase subunit 5 [Bombus hypocrita sapporensis]ABY75178.1 NADH dehydrogenase subunit 5 [Bombus hypocrita sapporensis]